MCFILLTMTDESEYHGKVLEVIEQVKEVATLEDSGEYRQL